MTEVKYWYRNVISKDTKPYDIVMQRLWDLMLHLLGVCS